MKRLNCKIFLLILSALIFTQCEPQTVLSPMQKRQITTKLYECIYENAFRASLTVLQDQGYVIKNTDMASGLILASVDRSSSVGSQIAQYLLIGFAVNKGTEIEVSCVVNKLSNLSSEIRISIQEVKYGEASSYSGTSKQSSKQIYEPNIYRNIFNQIDIEIRRREAINGKEIVADNGIMPSSTPIADATVWEAITENTDVRITLINGNILKGKIGKRDSVNVRLLTTLGEIIVERKNIRKIDEVYEYVSVQLSNGTTIKGKIEEQNEKTISIKTDLGIITINRIAIHKISRWK